MVFLVLHALIFKSVCRDQLGIFSEHLRLRRCLGEREGSNGPTLGDAATPPLNFCKQQAAAVEDLTGLLKVAPAMRLLHDSLLLICYTASLQLAWYILQGHCINLCACAQDHKGKQQQQVVAKELEVNKPQQQASMFQLFMHSSGHGHFGLLPEPCM